MWISSKNNDVITPDWNKSRFLQNKVISFRAIIALAMKMYAISPGPEDAASSKGDLTSI